MAAGGPQVLGGKADNPAQDLEHPVGHARGREGATFHLVVIALDLVAAIGDAEALGEPRDEIGAEDPGAVARGGQQRRPRLRRFQHGEPRGDSVVAAEPGEGRGVEVPSRYAGKEAVDQRLELEALGAVHLAEEGVRVRIGSRRERGAVALEQTIDAHEAVSRSSAPLPALPSSAARRSVRKRSATLYTLSGRSPVSSAVSAAVYPSRT